MNKPQCTRVEPIIRGFTWVKFEDDKERHKLWQKSYEQCPETSTQSHIIDGCTFHRCEKHKQNDK